MTHDPRQTTLESSHYLRSAGLTEIAKSHNYNNDGDMKGHLQEILKKLTERI